jgi:CRISPR-associated endoribonuclease Cas6
MPIALVFTVRPHEPVDIGSGLGRATYAATLRLLKQTSVALADQLHDQDGLKPLTVSSVMLAQGGDATGRTTPEQSYAIRVTALAPDLEEVLAQWLAQPPEYIALDTTRWLVEAVTADGAAHPWAGQCSYAELATPGRTRGPPGRQRWEWLFDAPVTFRQRGMNQPFPLPDLVFGSVLERWNSFAPLPLPDDLRAYINAAVAVSAYDMRSVRATTKNNAVQVGALGRCTYIATQPDRYGVPGLDVLSRFAFYCGVGAGTTRGFGRARLLAERPG